MNQTYDMIVIGAGSGGLSMALGIHKLGLRVLLIDRSDQSIGGECLNNGCVPSKAFIHISKLIGSASVASRFGITLQGRPSMQKIWQYVQTAQAKIRKHENAQYFRDQGLEVVLGQARFTGKNEVVVNGQQYSGKKITIATGSKPRQLEVPGIDKIECYDNESIWQLTEIPSSMLFIGAGPINMELGQAFARLGSKVMVVEMTDRILTKECPEISAILLQESQKLGIEFHLNCTVERFVDAHTARLKTTNGSLELSFGVAVAGVGRTINCHDLNPKAAGVQLQESGAPVVDEYLRTTNKNILTIGDVAGGPRFSHAAELQATIHIYNLFTPIKKKIDYCHFSWVTFTDPEVATFGFTEHQLKENGQPFEKLVFNFEDDDRAITSNYTYGKLIIWLTPSRFPWSSPKLLGGTMIAPQAGEMIQELILAKTSGLGIKSLFDKIYPYPTGSRVNKTIVMHKYLALVKPWMKKVLRRLY